MSNHKPATALPFDFAITNLGPRIVDAEGEPIADVYYEDDAIYLAHCANAYPKLIDKLRERQSQPDVWELLRELGEVS